MDDAEDEYRQALDNVRNWDFGTDEEPEMPTITVDLNYGRKRLMSSIAVSVSGKDEYGDSYKGSLSLTLSQQNAVSVDDPDLTDTVSKAKDNNELDLSGAESECAERREQIIDVTSHVIHRTGFGAFPFVR